MLETDLDGALANWRAVLAKRPDDAEAHRMVALLLDRLGRWDEARPHVEAIGEKVRSSGGEVPAITTNKHLVYVADGEVHQVDYGHYRGERANFHPTYRALGRTLNVLKYFAAGLTPEAPPFVPGHSSVLAIGSCFAAHISDHLASIGFEGDAQKGNPTRLADGAVNTYAIRATLEAAGPLLDAADGLVITLGLSEVWYDLESGRPYPGPIPREQFDPLRHGFRKVRHSENAANLKAIYRHIRERRPTATVVFTLSPIPLAATFRPIPCVVADAASKASLRSAVDEFMLDHEADQRLFYFPSYEVVTRAFDRPWMPDKRHVRPHVLDFNMALFERYFCQTGLTDGDVAARYAAARALDV
jgi:hypothetical protein